MKKILDLCIKCKNFVIVEEKIGYCKLFDNLQNARSNKNLCGPDGKYFQELNFINVRPKVALSVKKPPSNIIWFPWFINW